METPEQNRNVFAIKKFLSEYLDLRKDKDNELETVDSIRKGVEFKGANLWISCKPCCRRAVGASGTYFTYDL